jgi:hypothetical protein
MSSAGKFGTFARVSKRLVPDGIGCRVTYVGTFGSLPI